MNNTGSQDKDFYTILLLGRLSTFYSILYIKEAGVGS